MRIHFTAIGGSIMHQLAIALHHKGYIVTGSDDEIFEPAKSNLKQFGLLPKQEGWFAEKIHPDKIDVLIVGMHARKDNPELQRAISLKIPVLSYPEFLYQQSQHQTRVVIAGSHGKTTTTAMVIHVLNACRQSFDYAVGAKIEGLPFAVQFSPKAPVIVIEGDEYLASPLHPQPKIAFYHPQIALLNGIAWDHINVFPTYEAYLAAFSQFLQDMQPGHFLAYNATDPEVCRLVNLYGQHLQLKPYGIHKHKILPNGKTVLLTPNGEQPVAIFGSHNLINLAGALTICQELGITNQQFYQAISNFTGAGNRLETLALKSNFAIFKDFAHAPSKVKATTNAVANQFKQRTTIACFELHTFSSLNPEFLPHYRHTLNNAQQAIVYFNAHTFEIKKIPPLSPNAVAAAFDHPNLQVITNSADLAKALQTIKLQDANLLLMSSGNFGGLNLQEIWPNALK